MSALYNGFFGFRESPFSLPPDPGYLYRSPVHAEAVAHLTYGIAEGGGFIQLTGEVGTGKTLLIRTLVERLPSEVDLALILYPMLTVTEFIAAILDELHVANGGGGTSLKELVDALNRALLGAHARGRRTILIIDEAQNLSREVLEQIRLLGNLETDRRKLLQIVLVGQPELADMLERPDLRQLASRVTARFRLRPLSAKEMEAYVAHRLSIAGGQGRLFTRPAMLRIHRAAHGIPRLINVLCDRALLGAYARGDRVVRLTTAQRAVREVGVTPARVKPRFRVGWMAAALALGVTLAWIAARYSGGMNPPGAPGGNIHEAPPPGPNPSVAVPAAPQTLGDLLTSAGSSTDLDTGFNGLFSSLGLDASAFRGGSGCGRALAAGFRCRVGKGGIEGIRADGHVALIELVHSGRSHHVLVTALQGDRLSLRAGTLQPVATVSEIAPMWDGRYLVLERSTPPEELPLKRGTGGAPVVWLRDALARAAGLPLPAKPVGVFDRDLEMELRTFQRAQGFRADGVVGRTTFERLLEYWGTVDERALGAEVKG